MLACAVDAEFQNLSAAIAVATGGRCKSAPPKSFARMMNKLVSPDDHMWKYPNPRSANNIDLSRNAVTYKDCDSLLQGLAAFTKRFPAIRMKNNMRREFDAQNKSFGYRTIMVNMFFQP